MREINRAVQLIGSALPLTEVVKFSDGHLACEMYQVGDEIFLHQFDGTRAVGYWRQSVTDIEVVAGDES